MIVRSTSQVAGTPSDATGPGWRSLRMLTKTDGMGFSLNETVCKAGAVLELEYKHHLEACYCVSGKALLTDLASGDAHRIEAGTVYALDQNDRHRLEVDPGQDLILISVFNPALSGTEVHGPDGSYEA